MALQQEFRRRRTEDLPRRPCRRCDAKRHRAVLCTRRAPHDGKDHAEARPCDPEPDEDCQKLMLPRRKGVGRSDQPDRIEQRPRDDGAAVPEPFRQGPEQRLPDAPRQILYRDGKREIRPRPAEFLRDGDLEDPKARPNRKGQHQDDATGDKDGADEGGFGCGGHDDS